MVKAIELVHEIKKAKEKKIYSILVIIFLNRKKTMDFCVNILSNCEN